MLVSWKWLHDYVTVDEDVIEYCNKMIMSGSNLETCKKVGDGIEGVLVGKIEKIEKHPNADKLVVCQLDFGCKNAEGQPEFTQIVTGADNVFEGAIVPVAVSGSKIPGPLHGAPATEGGVEIKSGELRGVLSDGMLCSATELGFDDKVAPMASKDGIWILGDEFVDKLGSKLVDALEIEDYTIEDRKSVV